MPTSSVPFAVPARKSGGRCGRSRWSRRSARRPPRDVKDAAKASAKNEGAAAKVGSKELATLATTPSPRCRPGGAQLFLGKLIDAGGDLGDLSRFTRTKAGSIPKRLDAALGELRGNLFSAVTGVTNALSGFTILGLNGTAMASLAQGDGALSPSAATYAQAARVQTMVTWAYVDGIMGGWRAHGTTPCRSSSVRAWRRSSSTRKRGAPRGWPKAAAGRRRPAGREGQLRACRHQQPRARLRDDEADMRNLHETSRVGTPPS
jgi:hypothetical protein